MFRLCWHTSAQSLSTKTDELRTTVRKLSERIGRVEHHLASVTAQASDASNKSKDDIDALCRLAKLIECHLALSNEFNTQCALAYAQRDAKQNHNEDPDQTDALLAQFQARIDILAQFIAFSDVILSHSNRFTDFAVSLKDFTRDHPWLRPCAAVGGGILGGVAGAFLLHFFAGGIAKATLGAGVVWIGGGVVLGVIAALALYSVLGCSKTTAEAAQMKKLRKCMEDFQKDPLKYSAQLEQLQKDMKAFYGPLQGAAHVASHCPVCHREDLTPCTHPGTNAQHEPTCTIQLYTCGHVLCHDCAATHGHETCMVTCPLCRKPRRQSAAA